MTKFDKTWMELARNLASLSSCSRRQVGAVLISSDNQQVISFGYNGNAKGFPNCCDSPEEGSCGCIHAECNAAVKNQTRRTEATTLYVTCFPCVSCAKLLVNMGGLKEIVYLEEYRNTDGMKYFIESNIGVRKYD